MFGTDAGPIRAEVLLDGPDAGRVKVQLTPPVNTETGIVLDIDGQPLTVHFSNTGVPHVVVFVDDVEAVDIMKAGPAIRYHEHFAPAGTNVNFAQLVGRELHAATHLRARRGGRDLRLRHGRGSHSASGPHSLGLTGDRADLTTSGGEVLTVFLEGGEVFLQGAAELTFQGEMYLDPLGLSL